MMRPLEGIRVIELAGVLAGPSAGMFLAELGAEVIKIENKKTGGDVTRTWKTTSEDPDLDTSAYYASVNLFKEVLLLDLSDEKDRSLCKKMVLGADIVISNFRSGSSSAMGFDAVSLTKENSSLICAELSGFPSGARPAFDVVLQAETGFMWMNGEADNLPVKMPVAFIDLLAGHHLKEAVLLALLRKSKTGKGSRITLSLYDAAISSLANQASNFLMTGKVPQRIGSLHPNIAPYGELFELKDGNMIILAVGSEKHFRALCQALDMPPESRFSSNQDRVINRKTLYRSLKSRIEGKSLMEIESLFSKADVPFGQIKDLQQVFDSKEATALVRIAQIGNHPSKAVTQVPFSIYDNH